MSANKAKKEERRGEMSGERDGIKCKRGGKNPEKNKTEEV